MEKEPKKREPRKKKKMECIIKFTNEPSPACIERMHRLVYEHLVDRLEKEYGHR